ncbi:CHAT domain-containing protein [Archangium violaceum]|uniref:CHAT domain-containing tetratricopeptide repeat protein n=1 Tax=Archangium violaceum TaxID=83451 RepID=UPI002B2BBDE7|nr:CHAT domain-containing protein [Archangium violaceum]
MWRILGWTVVVVLCCATGKAVAGEDQPEPRLSEAQTAFEEATKLLEAGRYAEALTPGEQALELREAVLGASHLEVAASLNLLGDLYRRQGDHARAERVLQRALAIREATLGKQHPHVAQLLHSLANLYGEQGAYSRAEPLYARALAILEVALGKQHPGVAASLNNLASLYWMQGMYSRAEPLHERALAIQETALGKQHPDVAISLNGLANLYMEQGMYSRAEPLYARALAIQEVALGKQHPDVAASLNNLALLYMEQGMYSRAEPLYARALAIQEVALGKQHPDVAISLSNLGHLYMVQGLYSRAEPLHERALTIWEAVLGKQHPHVAISLNNLANLYTEQGLHSRATYSYRPEVGWAPPIGYERLRPSAALNRSANLYNEQVLYSRAESLYERALAIQEAALGKQHPYVAESLKGLARLRLAQDQTARAVSLLSRAFSISELRLRQEGLDFSESRLASFLQVLRSEEDFLYSLLREHPDDASVRRLALSSVLLRKGRSVEETANTSRTIYFGLGDEDRNIFERLRGLRTQLATLSHQGPGSLSPADYQQRLESLAEQGNALETQLARRSAPLRVLTALPGPEQIVDRVAAALPRDGALVEFVAYTEDRPVEPTPGTPGSQLASELRYLALVLLPNATIRTVDLGPAAAIDQAASTFRDALASSDAAWQGPARALYSLAFGPLKPLLGNVRRVFLAPDGQLNLVPFAALHDGKGLLVDSFHFTYLSSGKDLLPHPRDIPPSRSVVVLADPDFGAPPSTTPGAQRQRASLVLRSLSVKSFFSTLRADFAERTWVPLPGTRREAEAIQRLLPQAQLFLGSEASKQRLLSLPAPGVLHIATHGFFLEDSATPDASRAVVHTGALSGAPAAQHLPDPLLRSGLVLSGPGAQVPHSPDGSLVTALELAGLDLWGTELVVLSACETGRGDVKLGQGVYGLRRALISAGAETVVSSLWKVNDDTTHQLMRAYYRHLLAGRPRVSALREAMLELRKVHPHPYAWAPFTGLGRDAPLRSIAPLPKE